MSGEMENQEQAAARVEPEAPQPDLAAQPDLTAQPDIAAQPENDAAAESAAEAVVESAVAPATESATGTGAETELVPVDGLQPAHAPTAPAEAPTVQLPTGPQPPPPALDPQQFFTMLHADPAANPFLVPIAPPRPKKALRLTLRYSAVLLTVLAVGAATAYAVTLPKRTDIPGLRTAADGRQDFGAAAKPANATSVSDKTKPVHTADLRQYLLKPPVGATVDPAYPGAGGWYPLTDFLTKQLANGDDLRDKLSGAGLRHIAAEAWTGPDGSHTAVFLLQFPDAGQVALTALGFDGHSLAYLKDESHDSDKLAVGDCGDAVVNRYTTVSDYTGPGFPKPTQGRAVSYCAGDVIVEIITVGPAHMSDVPTTQVAELQAAMLQ